MKWWQFNDSMRLFTSLHVLFQVCVPWPDDRGKLRVQGQGGQRCWIQPELLRLWSCGRESCHLWVPFKLISIIYFHIQTILSYTVPPSTIPAVFKHLFTQGMIAESLRSYFFPERPTLHSDSYSQWTFNFSSDSLNSFCSWTSITFIFCFPFPNHKFFSHSSPFLKSLFSKKIVSQLPKNFPLCS